MTRLITFLIFGFTMFVLAAPAGWAASPTALEQLKSLAGNWQAKMEDGSMATVSYELVSGGTAVMERLKPGKEAEMVTVYYPDNDSVMMTHYCLTNNQPRMRASGTGDGKPLSFQYVDATNLSDPAAMHMRGLVVTFQDPDHFTQQWTSSAKGQESQMTLHFERVK